MRLAGDIVSYAAHVLYCSAYASEAEERGHSFGAVELTEAIERQPDSVQLPIAWRYIGRIEQAWGADVALVFHHMGLDDSQAKHALSDLLMGCSGEGVGIGDDFSAELEQAGQILRKSFDETPIHFEGLEWMALADDVLCAAGFYPAEECINLDGLTVDELRSLETRSPQYRDYASQRANAMVLRETGSISAALVIERRLEAIYEDLPESLKW